MLCCLSLKDSMQEKVSFLKKLTFMAKFCILFFKEQLSQAYSLLSCVSKYLDIRSSLSSARRAYSVFIFSLVDKKEKKRMFVLPFWIFLKIQS